MRAVKNLSGCGCGCSMKKRCVCSLRSFYCGCEYWYGRGKLFNYRAGSVFGNFSADAVCSGFWFLHKKSAYVGMVYRTLQYASDLVYFALSLCGSKI